MEEVGWDPEPSRCICVYVCMHVGGLTGGEGITPLLGEGRREDVLGRGRLGAAFTHLQRSQCGRGGDSAGS
jgi:hypothetical protein